MALFVKQDFIGHAGQLLHWKIECDALTDEDWHCLAFMAVELCGGRWSDVIGIPRGGYKLSVAIKQLASWDGQSPRLIVDDVLTTGGSMVKALDRPSDVGLVVFARGPLPRQVRALFAMSAAMAAEYNRGFDNAASAGP